jgi:hypothetical protein
MSICDYEEISKKARIYCPAVIRRNRSKSPKGRLKIRFLEREVRVQVPPRAPLLLLLAR